MKFSFEVQANAFIDTQTAIFAEIIGSGMSSLDDLHCKHPFGGPGKPEDIAKFAVVLANDDAAWVSGANMFVDGGYTARQILYTLKTQSSIMFIQVQSLNLSHTSYRSWNAMILILP